jgi:Family of unknown function (DUF6375)
MKVWYGYGSEHSANLVIIGSFKSADDASAVAKLLEEWTTMVEEEPGGSKLRDYSDKMLDFISKNNIGFIGPADSEELRYEYDARREKNRIVIKTEEMGIGAFVKAILWKGGTIEVYSAHDHPNTPYGRGKG